MQITSAGTASPADPSACSRVARHGLLLTFAALAVFGIAARILYVRGLPLWFDETFTAVIATQPTLADLVRWCLSELTGPAFYMPMWLWTQVAGASDTALRMPGLIMSIAAPLILAWRGHPDRDLRLGWATLALLSTPMIVVATEARPYSQLFLLGCLQAIAFLATMRTPTIRTAMAWTTATALLILTHYYSLVPAGIEGLMLLAVHRRTILRCWPALLPFVPVAAWMAYHLHFMLSFASTLSASFQPAPWYIMAMAPFVLVGAGPLLGPIALAIVIVTSLIALPRVLRRMRPLSLHTPETPEHALAWAGVLTLIVMIVIGFVRPGFSSRYLTPALPAMLFALALWGRAMLPRHPLAVIAAAVSLLIGVGGTLQSRMIDPQFAARQVLSFAVPSAWLSEAQPRRLVFLWQSPNGTFGDARNLREMAGFFFRRTAHPVPVTLVRQFGVDPNSAVTGAAGNGPAAILWLRDANAPHGGMPAVSARYPGWQCRDFGADDIMIYACRRPLPRVSTGIPVDM